MPTAFNRAFLIALLAKIGSFRILAIFSSVGANPSFCSFLETSSCNLKPASVDASPANSPRAPPIAPAIWPPTGTTEPAALPAIAAAMIGIILPADCAVNCTIPAVLLIAIDATSDKLSHMS